jgi:hypothetical protein
MNLIVSLSKAVLMVYPPLTEISCPVTCLAARGDENANTSRPTSLAVVSCLVGVSSSMQSIWF